jgi:hypothetical protein
MQLRKRRSGEEIQRLVVEYQASGMRVSEFCRHQHLKPSVLRRRLKSGGLGKLEPKEAKGLVAVALVGEKGHGKASNECALEVVLSARRRIGVRPDFDAGTLERLLELLERV